MTPPPGPRRGGGPGMPGFAGRGARDFDFAVGSVAGIRWWQLGDGATSLQPLDGWTLDGQVEALAGAGARLRGSLETWEPGVNNAECYGPRQHPAGEIPVELGCGCGYWGYWTPGGQFPAGSRGTGWDVVGVIEGAGPTLIGEEGFRCARARITALHLATDLLHRGPGGGYDYVSECWRTAVEYALAARYGVTVYATIGAMLELHPPASGYGPARTFPKDPWHVPPPAVTHGGGARFPGRGASVADTMAYANAAGLAGLRPAPGNPPAPDPGWRPVTAADVRPGQAPAAAPVPALPAAAVMTPIDALGYLMDRRQHFDEEDR